MCKEATASKFGFLLQEMFVPGNPPRSSDHNFNGSNMLLNVILINDIILSLHMNCFNFTFNLNKCIFKCLFCIALFSL